MNEEAALLRAICEHPDEDTPRLVFADWLDEQGGRVNIAWAELIRVQIALDRDPGADDGQLRVRERATNWITGPAWTERMGLPGPWRWRVWLRGFPTVLHDPPPESVGLSETAPPIPVREVVLNDRDDEEFCTFLRWPGLRAVRKLALWEVASPFTTGILAVTRCEYFANLESLRMTQVRVTDEVALAILDSPYLTRLTDLFLGAAPPVSSAVGERLNARFGNTWH